MEVEVGITKGLLHICHCPVGLLETSVKESKEQIKPAINKKETPKFNPVIRHEH